MEHGLSYQRELRKKNNMKVLIENAEKIKEYKSGNETLTEQYLEAGGIYMLQNKEGKPVKILTDNIRSIVVL
jgi:hypothetical protein